MVKASNSKKGITGMVKSIFSKPKVTKKKVITKTIASEKTTTKKKVVKSTKKVIKKTSKKVISKITKKVSKKKVTKKVIKVKKLSKRALKKKELEESREEFIDIEVSNDLIKEVVDDTVGEDAIVVALYLKGKKNVSEFVIAEDLDIEIHAIRNILYRLNNEMIVTYIRKKDKIKGWYISYWTLIQKNVPQAKIAYQKKRLESFKIRLDKEEVNVGQFYLCPHACVRLDFDSAVEANFKCSECGSLLNLQDNVKTIERLKKNIEELEKELSN